MKEETKENLLIGAAIFTVAALCFIIGLAAGSKKKKQMVVTEAGKLSEQEIES